MNGICYYTVANSSLSFQKPIEKFVTVFANRYHQTEADDEGIVYYYYGMGQLGFSTHTFSNEPFWDVMLGSPGTFSWSGTPVLLSENKPNILETIVPRDLHLSYEYLGK